MAVCRVDDNPLVVTLEKPKYEFYCLKCGMYYEFLRPKAAVETPELTAVYEENVRRFKAGERHGTT